MPWEHIGYDVWMVVNHGGRYPWGQLDTVMVWVLCLESGTEGYWNYLPFPFLAQFTDEEIKTELSDSILVTQLVSAWGWIGTQELSLPDFRSFSHWTII